MHRLPKAACLAAMLMGLLPLVMGPQGCQTEVIITDNTNNSTDGQDGGDDNDLTSQEKQAIAAACNAPGTIANATNVSQNATGDLAGDNEHAIPDDGRDVTFGTCPTVTKSGSLAGGQVSLTIDFGAVPCTALTMEDGTAYVCSGTATGTFALLAKSLSLEFAQIACNAQVLDGMARLDWELDTAGVWFDGDWDLTWTIEDYIMSTRGTGRAGYEWVTDDGLPVTTIESFTGELTELDDVWSLVMDNIKVSLAKYASFIPYSGYMIIDGPDIRPITITFTENSPIYGEVIITVTPGRTMTISLYELEEWLAMYPVE